MFKVLTKNLYRYASKRSHPGGPALFIDKLIKSCARQGLAEFTFEPGDDYDAVLDETIDLHRRFTLDEVRAFRSKGKPFVLRLNGVGHQKFQERYISENCGIIPHAAHIIYQSQFCKNAWMASCGCSVVDRVPNTIIMNGDDAGRFDVEPMFDPLPGTTFAAVASWGPAKKMGFIVSLFKSLIRQGADVSLLLGGRFKDGVTVPPIEDEFTDRIRFCGYIEQSEIPSFYRSADAFIHARRGDWCPNSVVEALCAGLPGVVHSVGGTLELLGEAGVAFDEHDIGKASSAVMQLIEDYEHYKNKVVERTKLLDIDFVAKSYVDVLKQHVGMPHHHDAS